MKIVVELTQAELEKRWAESAILGRMKAKYDAACRRQAERTQRYEQKIKEQWAEIYEVRKQMGELRQRLGRARGAIETLNRAKAYRRDEMRRAMRNMTTVKIRIARSLRKEKLLQAQKGYLRSQVFEHNALSAVRGKALDKVVVLPSGATEQIPNETPQGQTDRGLPGPNLDPVRTPDNVHQADESR